MSKNQHNCYYVSIKIYTYPIGCVLLPIVVFLGLVVTQRNNKRLKPHAESAHNFFIVQK